MYIYIAHIILYRNTSYEILYTYTMCKNMSEYDVRPGYNTINIIYSLHCGRLIGGSKIGQTDMVKQMTGPSVRHESSESKELVGLGQNTRELLSH